MAFKNFRKSEEYGRRYAGVPFGLTLVTGCQSPLKPSGFDQHKRKLLRKMRKRETLADISRRIDAYDRFFRDFGFECPLPKHLKRTIHSGFPRYNLMVDAHFMAEMCAGILVAVTDFDAFDGDLRLDVAQEGEMCRGMGERDMVTKDGEIVLRDGMGIVCVLCQGADEKTKVREGTRNVLFYAYGIPGVEARHIEHGLAIAAETMKEFGRGTPEGIEVY